MNNLGLYIHIPFCVKKCAYCDFISFDNNDISKDIYIESILNEISLYEKILSNYNIDSVFFGGGTPSSIDSKHISRIIEKIPFKSCEITIECNPGTLTKEKLLEYKKIGINRISIGLQSSFNNELKALGRIHTKEEFLNSYNLVREVGFDNVNVDIMYGIPEQTINSLKETLKFIKEINPEHISCYSLIIEEGTPISKMTNINLPNEDEENEMTYLIKEELESAEYFQYEISNFSKKNYECKHNLKYWELDDYLGVGLAAHSFIDKCRFYNYSDFKMYIDSVNNGVFPIQLKNNETNEELLIDAIITGFRLVKGINVERLESMFQIDFYNKYRSIINKYTNLNLMAKTQKGYKLTQEGMNVSNSILSEFV